MGQLLEVGYDRQVELCTGVKVTLNGMQAVVTGAGKRFAMVTQFRTGLGCQFSWQAVESVVAKGGDFKSF